MKPLFKTNENDESEAKTLKKGGISVHDLSKTFEDLTSKHSVDQVILRTRAHRMEKPKRKTSSVSDYEQDLGYSPLTEETRAWILAGAKNDEAGIRSLLNTNPKIYTTRDPTTGYTCLHWAAKYGNESLIHLLIGRYRMNPNIRTRYIFIEKHFFCNSIFNVKQGRLHTFDAKCPT